jgi:membrane protein implicated in regulation of membrane protease activity
MIAVYIAALVIAVGALVLQLAAGHDGASADHDLAHGATTEHDFAPWTLFTSVRFWSFGLLAFGLVGTLLSAFGLAGGGVIAIVASVAGVSSGAFAAILIRRMMQRPASSHASSGEIVGKVGRILVAPGAGGLGKVRVEIKGSLVDYTAKTADDLAEGDVVVVEECDGKVAVVSRAPRELKS